MMPQGAQRVGMPKGSMTLDPLGSSCFGVMVLLPSGKHSLCGIGAWNFMSSSPTSPSPESGRNFGPSTLAIHAGEARQKIGDSITDPIVCASTYTFTSTQAVIDFIEQKQEREEYGRYGNPGEKVVEKKLAALEGGEPARS